MIRYISKIDLHIKIGAGQYPFVRMPRGSDWFPGLSRIHLVINLQEAIVSAQNCAISERNTSALPSSRRPSIGRGRLDVRVISALFSGQSNAMRSIWTRTLRGKGGAWRGGRGGGAGQK